MEGKMRWDAGGCGFWERGFGKGDRMLPMKWVMG